MKRQIVKIISVLMAISIIVSASGVMAFADDATNTTAPSTSQKTQEEVQKELEKQREELEKKLKESQARLSQFGASAKQTEEYINALDEKIGYLNEELNLLDKEIEQAQQKVDVYKKQVKTLKKEMKTLQDKFDVANKEMEELNADFDATYDAYCLRLKAMYISGTSSIIVALLTSKDISQLLSRYQMIRAISRSDTKLLNEVNEKIEKINEKKVVLDEEKKVLDKKNEELTKKQDACKAEQEKVEQKQQEVANKKIAIAEQRAESDALLAQYAQQTQMYGEYRNEDEALIKSVDKEINDLLSGLKTPDEVTTAVSTTGSGSHSNYTPSSTGSLFARSNAVLSLGYPVPGYHGVSAPFGHYSNGKPHTGTDFPCPRGSKVVAAQKGIVITVKRLDYSYGYYVMIYHGTDKQGRKVVTLYAHNSSLLVSVGQSVTKGQQIAASGSTGNSTGPHSHFEVIINGTKVNPKNYLV